MLRNPFRFGARWSWIRVTTEPYFKDGQPFMNVTAKVRWWHPLAWFFVAGRLLKHVRRRCA